jgi:hypothetical protein
VNWPQVQLKDIFDIARGGSPRPRSVGEVALIRHTISHYSPVLIAPLSNQFPRAGIQKKKSASPAREFPLRSREVHLVGWRPVTPLSAIDGWPGRRSLKV